MVIVVETCVVFQLSTKMPMSVTRWQERETKACAMPRNEQTCLSRCNSGASMELRYLNHLCYQEARSSEQETNLAPFLPINLQSNQQSQRRVSPTQRGTICANEMTTQAQEIPSVGYLRPPTPLNGLPTLLEPASPRKHSLLPPPGRAPWYAPGVAGALPGRSHT